jgi:hypothetical protein
MLRDPLQKKRKDAEEHMRADTIRVPVEDRPDLDRRFHRSPGLFHPDELFIGQGQVLGRKIIIVAVDDPHAVAFFLLLDGRLIQPELAVFQPANIRAEAPARDKTTGALGMDFQTPDLFFEFFQELLPMLPLPVRLLAIMTDDKVPMRVKLGTKTQFRETWIRWPEH